MEEEREGAAEKSVRVVAGRRRKEAKSLEAMVAGCVRVAIWTGAIVP
jgi:hypothetical protein